MKNLRTEFDIFLPHQEEMSFSDKIAAAINNYKISLHKYLVEELLAHLPEIYIGYFNCHPLLNQLNIRSTDPLINIYHDLLKNDDIRRIFSSRFNLMRALANYHKMHHAQTLLSFSSHNIASMPALGTPAGRIRALFYSYPEFQKHLQTVSHVRADKSLSKVKQFFMKIGCNIIWIFSKPYAQGKNFTHQIRSICHEYNHYKTKKIDADIAIHSGLQTKS